MTDIVLITVDSLRADHVGWHGYDRPTTPHLDEIASNAHSFSNTFAHAGSTRPSFPSILTSSYALMYGGPERLSEDRTIVSEPLNESGYTTAGFHSNLFLSADFGYSRGFDQFFDAKSDPSMVAKVRQFVKKHLNQEGRLFQFLKSTFDATEKHAGVELGSAYVNAEDLTDRVLDWVNGTTSRDDHFLWAHYMDVHHPYLPPAEHQQPFRENPIDNRRATRLRRKMLEEPDQLSDDEHQALVDLYDAEIHYVDSQVDRLLSTLRDEWGEDIIVIFTADHGEEFKDHGSYSHGTLHDEGIHVPLLIEDNSLGGEYDEMVGLLDLAPTITDYAGTSWGENWYGHSIRSLIEDDDWERDSVLGNWGDPHSEQQEFFYRDKEWKYIDGHEGEQLYHVTEDPGEKRECSEEYSDELARIRGEVDELRERIQETHQDLGEVHMDEETKERLAMLGYREE